MRRVTIAISLVAATAIPISAAQANDSAPSSATKAARQACRTERRQIGSRAFRAKYGPREAMRNCIVAHGGQVGGPGEGSHHHHGHQGHGDRGRHRSNGQGDHADNGHGRGHSGNGHGHHHGGD